MERYVLGLDIGGTNIRIAMRTRNGQAKHFHCVPRTSILSGKNSLLLLAQFIEKYIAEHGAGQRPENIVLGFPATINAARKIILQAPNIPGLDGIPAADQMEQLLHLPVYLEKDVNLLFYSDMEDLCLPENGIGIGVYVGTGIGHAIFLNGRPLSGKNGVSGELGHIPRAGGNEPCGCGNLGCAECYASGWKLVQLRDQLFPTEEMSALFSSHADNPKMADYVDQIACTIAAEINILDPDYIVLGGGVINMPDFPVKALEDKIYQHTRKPYPADNLQFYYSKDTVENGVRGALSLGWKKAMQNIATTK